MRNALKTTANLLAFLLVAPAWLVYLLGSAVAGKERCFPGWSQLFAIFPGITGVYLRRAFYRLTLDACSDDCWIGFGTVFSHPTACVGKRVYVGLYCMLGSITLEDDALLGSHVSIINGASQHGIERLDIPIREQPGVFQPVTIGRDTWIGERATVLANVGKQCVIGAGSVVTKPIADYAIAVGVPARIVRYRQSSDGEPPACAVSPE